jgi:protein SSD1
LTTMSTTPTATTSTDAKKPATPTPAGANASKRSSSRSNKKETSPKTDKKDTPPKAEGAVAEKKGAGSHQRKASGRGGGSRRGSQGAGSTAKKEPTTPPQGSEGLANLKNIISELKDSPSGNASSMSSLTQPQPTSSPARGRNPSHHHKNASSNSVPSPPSITAPLSVPSSSTLNPNAGGFHPGTLGPIHDMMDEGLITPTASHFDLMTGLPRSPPLGTGAFGRQQAFTDFATLGQGELPEEIPGFGGVAGMNQRAFAFPQTQQSLAQQQHFLQLQQQQQAFQMQQLANIGYGAGGVQSGGGGGGAPRFSQQPGVNDATDLIAEQLAIQQQLANLRIQQENLLARFGDMQAGGAAAETTTPRMGLGQQHRRVQSQQSAMGSFGQGMGTFGQGGSFGGVSSTSSLPKGHGRRHSVTVGGNKSTSISSPNLGNNNNGNATSPVMQSSGNFSPAMSQNAMSPPMGSFSSFGGGFQFPNAGVGQSQPLSQADASEFGMGGGDGGSHRGFGHQRRTSGSMSSLGGWQSMSMLAPSSVVQVELRTDVSRLLFSQTKAVKRTSPKLKRISNSSQRTAPRPVIPASLRSACRLSAVDPVSSQWRDTEEVFPSPEEEDSRRARACLLRTFLRLRSRPCSRRVSSSLAC